MTALLKQQSTVVSSTNKVESPIPPKSPPNIWKILCLVIIFLLLTAGLVFAGFYIGKNPNKWPFNLIIRNKPESTSLPKPTNTPQELTSPSPEEQAQPPEDSQVAFLAAPKKMTNLGILQSLITAGLIEANDPKELNGIENNSTYYELGTIKEGKYKDKKLVLIETKNMPSYGPGPGEETMLWRLILDDNKIIYLGNNNQYTLQTYEKTTPGNLVIENDFTITSLKLKDEILVPYKGVNLVFQRGWLSYLNSTLGIDKIAQVDGNNFYREQRSIAGKKIFKDIGKKVKYFLKLSDGSYELYYLSPKYIATIPQKYQPLKNDGSVDYDNWVAVPKEYSITWTDGLNPQINPEFNQDRISYSEFVYSDMFGNIAGLKYYDKDLDLDNELVKVGSNNAGEEFYGLKDSNHLIYTDFYEKRNKGMNWVNNLSLTDFKNNRPVYFWKDVFQDYHALFRSDFEEVLGIAKPAVYLYPEKETVVLVKIDPLLTNLLSIPAYGSGWQVLAKPDGTIIDKGKFYDYLFYEGDKNFVFSSQPYDLVKKENLLLYFSKKLASLGLNEKESQQFINYWWPKMQSHKMYKIEFMTTPDLQQVLPLYISPKPDSLIRILMKYSQLDDDLQENINYSPNLLQRNGFVAVEWGGIRN